ncbi:MAG: PAAR domain-containing protein [Myxococcales bacterium]|nr:PAAR domain-containing protein [Myxococcales bacterium]
MPPQSRVGDTSKVQADAHGCPACPHTCVGPAIMGSPDVMVNGKPALRVGDPGMHAACCGPNTWTAQAGSGTVFINNIKAHRKGDADTHCGGSGTMQDGSSNVETGG